MAHTFNASLVGLCIWSVRRAVFVTGISSNMTIDFAENNASTTSVGSRDADAFRAFVMRGGVTATYDDFYKIITIIYSPNKTNVTYTSQKINKI